MSTVEVRTARIDDAEAVAALITGLGYPTSAEAMRTRLAALLLDADHVTLVADVQGVVSGLAGGSVSRYYEKDGLYARLLVLAVSPDVRGLGIGGRLVRAVEQWGRQLRRARGVREQRAASPAGTCVLRAIGIPSDRVPFCQTVDRGTTMNPSGRMA